MNNIKLYGLHSRLKDSKSLVEYFRFEKLTDEFNFIWSPDDFDYLFATEQTYQNPKLFRQFKELYPKAKIRILWAGEAMSPDFNLFDYAVGFDDGLSYGDRFAQLPPPWEYPGKKFINSRVNEITTMEQAKKELSQKTGFCNFLYSNSNAHPMRDRLFYEVSKYKHVDSLGKHLNNVGHKGTGFSGFQNTCIDIKRPYKFSIACENAVFAGYTSEKILTSLGAHTIPIYFGDPAITKHINPECFINCNKLGGGRTNYRGDKGN